MMLGVPGIMGSWGGGVEAAEAQESVGASSAVRGGGVEESEKRVGGGRNRWPKQETLALLKVRLDMDVAFRESNFKGSLWEQVSRKMGELGFQRSGKKCREKFENVNKYHKRTKQGRASNPVGKTYRFFDQLKAWENTPVPLLSFPGTYQPPPPPPLAATMTMRAHATSVPIQTHNVGTVPSISPDPLRIVHPNYSIKAAMNSSNHPPIGNSASFVANSTSSSTSSDEGLKRRRRKKRKRKDFLGSLIKSVFEKQEELQKKFLDELDQRERDQTAIEEARRNIETQRINREHELLVQERSISAAKDSAVVAFLQKLITDHQSSIGMITNSTKTAQLQVEAPAQQSSTLSQPTMKILNTQKADIVLGDRMSLTMRWPKAEVEALINLRTGLDLRYQENVPKRALWEEISASMGELGYSRSSKRCKEKWENINKYFKKVKESSSKKRPEDSKTCPYFHRLDALHEKRVLMKITDNGMLAITAQLEQQQLPAFEQQQPVSTLHDEDQDEEIENIDHEEEEFEGGG